MTPLNDPSNRDSRSTSTHQPRKGSDHDDNHQQAEDGRRTGDRRTIGNGARPDHPEGDRNQSDTDRPRRPRRRTSVARPQRADGGTGPPTPDDRQDGGQEKAVRAGLGPVTLKATPEGALWVMVEGADFTELADRISAVCDALTRPTR